MKTTGADAPAQHAAEPAVGGVHDRLDGQVGREQVGEDHDVGRADHGAADPLLVAGIGGVGQVERERALDRRSRRTRPADCAGSIPGRGPSRASSGLTDSVAAMRATPGSGHAECPGELHRALHDVDLLRERGMDGDARVGQQESPAVAGDLHEHDLADDAFASAGRRPGRGPPS